MKKPIKDFVVGVRRWLELNQNPKIKHLNYKLEEVKKMFDVARKKSETQTIFWTPIDKTRARQKTDRFQPDDFSTPKRKRPNKEVKNEPTGEANTPSTSKQNQTNEQGRELGSGMPPLASTERIIVCSRSQASGSGHTTGKEYSALLAQFLA
jgi:hypothetical protein